MSLTTPLFQTLCDDVRANQQVSDQTMLTLYSLFGQTLNGALETLDENRVTLATAPSGRSVFLVQGSSKSTYVCLFQSGYCTCPDFTFNVIGRGSTPMCKHILAVGLADALGKFQVTDISEQQLITYLRAG